MQLLDLPEEVLLTILSGLGVRDLLAFSSANRCTKTFYENSIRLQYIAELDAAGCHDASLDTPHPPNDGHASTASITERLDYLRTREARWRELNLLRSAVSIPLPDSVEVNIYDLSAGVFAYGEVNRGDEFKYVNLREVSRRSNVSAFKGKDKTRRRPVLRRTDVPWESFPFEGNVADFGLALREYDLIALISFCSKEHEIDSVSMERMQEIRLHLLLFSERLPHPLAKDPVVRLAEKPLTYGRPSPAIEVAGKYIIILLNFPRVTVEECIEDLYIYNWQSGKLVLHETYDASTYLCLAFVTPSLFAMPNLQDNSLDLVHIFNAMDGVEHVCWLRKLRLPELVRSFKLRSASCRGDPNPMETTPDCLSRDGNPVDPNPYDVREKRWGAAGYAISADPLRAIISFNFVISHEHVGMPFGPAVNFILHRSTLAHIALDGLEQRKKATLGSDANVAIPETKWEDWGPGVTRWRLEDDTVEWVTTTAGQRQVFSSLSSDNPWRPIIVVRDYNPFEVRRARTSGEDIYVDSRDGVRASDSEDEDEYGLGGDAEEQEDSDGEGSPEAAVTLNAFMTHAMWADVEGEQLYDNNGDANAGDPGQDNSDVSSTSSPATASDSDYENGVNTNPPLTRISVRVRDTVPDFGIRYYKKGSLRGGLPCVEYTVEGSDFLYTGLLMDEERIIGYLEESDGVDLVEKMLQISVFSMHP